MIGLSINEFINTLKKIVLSSPSSILFVIFGFIFLIAMVINVRKKRSIGKTLFLIGWIFIVIFLITKYNRYLTTLLDNLINNVFMQVFFPNLATYVIIIILSNIIYIRSALKKDKKNYEKIINTIFFVIIMFGMNYTLEEVIRDNINIYDVNLYSNQKILVLVQSTTMMFIVWQVFLMSKKIIKILIGFSNDKIEKNSSSDILSQKDGLSGVSTKVNNLVQEELQMINQTPNIVQEESQMISQIPSEDNANLQIKIAQKDSEMINNKDNYLKGVNIKYVNPMSNLNGSWNKLDNNVWGEQSQNSISNLNNGLPISSNVFSQNVEQAFKNNVLSSEQKMVTKNLQPQSIIPSQNNGSSLNAQGIPSQNNVQYSNNQITNEQSNTTVTIDIFNQMPK